MKNIKLFCCISFVLILISGPALARISVVSVKGRVAYKSAGRWLPLKMGQTLSEGAKISTGVKSSAVLKVDNHQVIVRPLSMIKIYENRTSKGEERTRLGLRRGGLRAKISRSSRVRTVFKVSTPVATSSVRGTEEEIRYGPGKGMRIEVLAGLIEGENRLGARRFISGRQVFTQKRGGHRPGNILSDLRKGTFVRIYSDFLTPDELRAMGFFGSDIGIGFEDAVGYINSRTRTPALVVLTIQWP